MKRDCRRCNKIDEFTLIEESISLTVETSSLSTSSTDNDEYKEEGMIEDGIRKYSFVNFGITSVLCTICMIINTSMAVILVEKRRIWSNGHVLPLWCDIAEIGYIVSFFLSVSGSFLAFVTKDWFWFIPGSLVLTFSTLLYLIMQSTTGCEY